MTTPINDGGPAFPCDPFIASKPGNEAAAKRLAEGMSLRDYFAAKVCGAMFTVTSADHGLPNLSYRDQPGGPTVVEKIATISYEVADAMLRARSEGEPDAT